MYITQWQGQTTLEKIIFIVSEKFSNWNAFREGNFKTVSL